MLKPIKGFEYTMKRVDSLFDLREEKSKEQGKGRPAWNPLRR